MARTKTYRQPTMRQIEAFKAVIETGTVSRAAEVLNMSQPAASKLLTNLEADIGLTLFERRRGLLVPNERGVRFYQEIDRIFSGLNQINRAVDSLRREEQGQLVIGCLPVSTDVRDGLQSGNWQYALSNRTPDAASASMLGVWARSQP